MQRRKSILLTGLLFLAVSFAFGQDVKVDYDHAANFSKYRTFSWIKQPDTPGDPLMKQRIINAVNMQLAAKGLKLVDSDGDLAVAVHVATQEKQTLNTFYSGMGGWGWSMGGFATTTVETYTEGAIVADLFDDNTMKVVWRGTAKKEVSSKPDKVAKQVEKAIEKMFKNFPPRAA